MKTSFLKLEFGPLEAVTGLILAMMALPAAALVTYEITDIGIPVTNPVGASSHVSAINDLGQVSAFSDTSEPPDINNRRFGFIWQNGVQTLLTTAQTPGGTIGIGTQGIEFVRVRGGVSDINNVGQVVGHYTTSSNEEHAFIWQNGDLTDLGRLGGADTSAIASNAAGQVWGNSVNGHGFIWQNGAFTDLGANTQVYAVNANGQAVIIQGGQYFLWQKDPVTAAETKQPLAGMDDITPQEINSAGTIVGISQDLFQLRARIWKNGSTTNLVTLDGAGQTHAYGINNAGQIVGFADLGDGILHALLWDSNGNLIDLTSVSNFANAGFARLGQGFSINNLGQIVGEAYLVGSGDTHGFLATPTGTLNWSAGSGAWDSPDNWDSGLGFTPNALLPAVIQPTGSSIVVDGPATDTVVNSLELGGGSGNATLNLNAGGLEAINQLNVHSNGTLNFSAPRLAASSISNQGTVNISGAGIHTITGDVTNDGTFKLVDTSVQYIGDFTNNGAYISDPSTSRFNNLSVGSNGYLVGGAGDQFIVTGDFNNASTQNTLWNTANADLIFSGQAGSQHTFGLASVDQGITNAIPINNFAWGSMTLSSGNFLRLVDGNTTPGAALYAGRIILPDGLSQLNSINSNYNVYFDPTLPDNQYLLGSIRRFGSGIGQLLPWSFMPFGSGITTDSGLTPNQQNFAAALDEACTAPTGILVTRCLQLQGLSLAQKKAAIASLTPDQVPGQMAGPIKFSATRMDAPFSRLASLRAGGGSTLLSFNFNGVQIPTGKRSVVMLQNAGGGGAGDDNELFRDNPLGIFIQSRFNFGNMQNNAWDRGFDSEARAVTVGADYRISDQLVAGLAFNYTSSSTQYVDSAGHMDNDTYMGAFYGSYYLPKDFYVDWVANYGGNEYSFNRQYGFLGFNGQSNANPTGNQYSVALSSGKDFNWQEWVIGPYLRLEYLGMHIGEYQEQGGNGFDMTTGAQTNHSFVSNLGTQISYAVSTPWGVITPAVRVEWEHQYLNDNRSIAMRLSQARQGLGNFIIQTGDPDRDYANLGGSVTAALPNGGAGFVRYETRLGQSYISDHIVEAGLRMSF